MVALCETSGQIEYCRIKSFSNSISNFHHLSSTSASDRSDLCIMATESATVNGVYDGQYGQPAELAATTPAHAPSASQSSATAQAHNTDPQEIGWYFVEQYYTTLAKSPDRIHLFYNKKSVLVTGRESEKVVPAVGVRVSGTIVVHRVHAH